MACDGYRGQSGTQFLWKQPQIDHMRMFTAADFMSPISCRGFHWSLAQRVQGGSPMGQTQFNARGMHAMQTGRAEIRRPGKRITVCDCQVGHCRLACGQSVPDSPHLWRGTRA